MTNAPQTYDLSLLAQSREKWRNSSALRVVYENIFSEMRSNLVSGSVLEIGSGIGMTRDYFPHLITSDIVSTPFADRAVSAYAVPAEGWNNIIAIDMLHHLQEPLRFLESAARALAPGGRIVLAEPAGTRWGRVFYGWFHHEPCIPDEVRAPYCFAAAADGSFANMGIAYALFRRDREKITAVLRQHHLGLVNVHYRDLLAYPATGGFSRAALLPSFILRGLLVIEGLLPQLILRFVALRMIVVLEKAQA